MNQSILLPISFWQSFLTVFFIFIYGGIKKFMPHILQPEILEPVASANAPVLADSQPNTTNQNRIE